MQVDQQAKCDQNASNLESDGLQNSAQAAITATVTTVVNKEHYYSSPIGYAQNQEPRVLKLAVNDLSFLGI